MNDIIKVGDRVKVAEIGESGMMNGMLDGKKWGQGWMPRMNDAVGKVGIVRRVTRNGIDIDFDIDDMDYPLSMYSYPLAVLEKVAEVKPRAHADMIIEWAKDSSKIVEYRSDVGTWHKTHDNKPEWDENVAYRFKPKYPESSLSDDNLLDIWHDINGVVAALREVANKAIEQYIKDAEKCGKQ